MAIQKEFGDFQTPRDLSTEICSFLVTQGVSPAWIVEPTCGRGSFILSVLEQFPSTTRILGVDINGHHLQSLKQELSKLNASRRVELVPEDFFKLDWPSILGELTEPILILSSPPWVKIPTLGDMPEWMLIHLVQWVTGRDAIVAMLCETRVVRKVLGHLWKNQEEIGQSFLYLLDGQKLFGLSMAMGLFVCKTKGDGSNRTCQVYEGLSNNCHVTTFGFRDGQLIADVESFDRWEHLSGRELYKWRSGVKHDAATVLELEADKTKYKNRLGETVILEDDYIYPFLKSSDIAHEKLSRTHRRLLITQTYVGEDTTPIKQKAPRTWAYLMSHRKFFEKRNRAIYREKPMFSIFGIGDYSFSPWKVAISGMSKKLNFRVVGPYEGKPVLLDDSCYFVSCESRDEARLLATLLNSSVAQEYLGAFIFWDEKRPVTATILRNLDLVALARELGLREEILDYIHKKL